MACRPPCKWPFNTSSTIRPPPLRPSLTICFALHFSMSKQRRPPACSLHHNSSSSSTPNSNTTDLSNKLLRVGHKNDVALVNYSASSNPNKQKTSSKALFKRKSLWRRVWSPSTKVRSIVLLNVITVVYASNVPVVKEVEAVMDAASFTVVRFVISAIPFIPFVISARGDIKTRNAGLELGFWVSLGYLMQALGLVTSDAGRASFISMFTVIVVPLLDGMLGAIVPARTWFGALMSIVGVAMLESSGTPPSIGDLLNFLSAVFFGIHMLRTEHISRSTSKRNFLPLLGYEVCVIALFSTMWYFIGGWFDGVEASNPSYWTWPMVWHWVVSFPWIPALYTGVFSTGLCLWLEMAAMCDVSATETAIIYGLEPVWGAAFAWFLLGERWGVAGWIGAALVLGGSLTVQIFGSCSSEEEKSKEADQLLASDKPKGFSTSPVMVSSKDIPNLLKK